MRRSLAALLCSALAALVLAACGGSSDNGVASKTPNQIATAATSAVSKASSVHVAGSLNSSGTPFTIDLSLVNGKGGRGSMSQAGLSFDILTVNQEVYINGSSQFWTHFGGASAARLLSGKWLKAPATGQFATLAMLTTTGTLFGQLLGNHGNLAKGKSTTVRGQKVIAVNDTSNGGTLYVATTGKPYPVEIVKSGTGRLDFNQFNQPVSLAPPANAIDISQFK